MKTHSLPRPRGSRLGDSRRILYVNRKCYLDSSNGAALASRALLEMLQNEGFAVEALTGAIIELGTEIDPRAWLAARGLLAAPEDATIPPSASGNAPDSPIAHRVINGVPVAVLVGHPGHAGAPSDEECRDFLTILDRTLARFRPDILLTFGGDRLSNIIRARARRRGAAVVFALHNFAYGIRWPFADVDAAIVPSQFAADYYRRAIGLDCTVLPNPVLPERVRAETYRPHYVTFVNPSPEKGVYPFARLADILAQRRPDIPLLVVEGRGSERTLAGCGLDLANNGNISLMSHTTDPRQFWSVTKICLLPSVWWENQPLVAVEALLNGIPVVGSNRGGIPEVLGAAGIVLPIPDRITPQSAELPTAGEVAPWIEAIIRLWDDEVFWNDQRRIARMESRRWAPGRVAAAHGRFFARIRPGAAVGPRPAVALPASSGLS